MGFGWRVFSLRICALFFSGRSGFLRVASRSSSQFLFQFIRQIDVAHCCRRSIYIVSTCRLDFPVMSLPVRSTHLAKTPFLWYPFVDKGDEEEEYAASAASERGWSVRIPAAGGGRSLRSFRAEAGGAFCCSVRRRGRGGGVMP